MCLLVVSAACGGFWPGKNIGDPSLYLWASIPLGGTGAHSDRVPLSSAAEASHVWGDSVVVFIVAVRRNYKRFAYFWRGNLFDFVFDLEVKHNLNPFAPMHTSIRRLCPQPPDISLES
jgi:hypothetical protein